MEMSIGQNTKLKFFYTKTVAGLQRISVEIRPSLGSLPTTVRMQMQVADKFSLKWNDFQTNVSRSFYKLRSEKDFHDVTLVSDDQRQISAHKLVLSSCSEYFKKILKQNKHENLLLCLEGISYTDLQ